MLALNVKNVGLYTFNNTISDVPPGSMAVAMNGVIDRPNVFETRRGFMQYGTSLSLPVNQYFSFQNSILVHHASTMSYDSDNAGTWIDYAGTYDPPAGVPRIRGVEANKNFYFLTSNGVQKLQTLTGTITKSGGIDAIDFTGAVTGATGFLANNFQCAYAVVWGYIDANGNEILGNPSMFVYVANTSGGTRNVALTITIPAEVTTSWFYQIYRTVQSTTSIPPGDNLQLAYQANPTAGEITAKSVAVTDITPDSLLGTFLYTSSAAQGPAATNDTPPLANDICNFQGMTFYFNCTTKQAVYITLLGTGAPNGIQVNDTVAVVGTVTRTYTGKAANNFAAQEFAVVTSGTVASNIDATARNLVACINQDPGNTEIYAYYRATFTTGIGVIYLKARDLSHAVFHLNSSRSGAWSPTIPATGTTYPSSNNQVLNGFYVSKQNQPEAVPLSSLNFIGSGNQQIYRALALRDAILVESDAGLYRITGTSPSNITVTPTDQTVFIKGTETAVKLNNSVYSYSTQGVVSVTDSAQIMSRNIEGDLLSASSSVYPNFATLSFAVSYESDRKYILFTNSAPGDTYSTIQYVYNWITQSWTTWNLQATAGFVNPFDNKIYYATPAGVTMKERKSFTLGDYADAEYAVNIISTSGTSIQLTDAANVSIGMSLGQGVTLGSGGISSIVTSIDLMTDIITVTDNLIWATGAANVYTPISTELTYQPISCGFPAYLKRFARLVQFIFSQANFDSIESRFNTNMNPSSESVTLEPTTSAGFGTQPWGTFNWGVSVPGFQSIPTFLPRNSQMCNWINISLRLNQAFKNMACDGLNMFYSFVSEVSR
jgi:hypothetical protein